MLYKTAHLKPKSKSLLLDDDGNIIGTKEIVVNEKENLTQEIVKYNNSTIIYVTEKRDCIKIFYEIGKYDKVFRRTVWNDKNQLVCKETFDTNGDIIKAQIKTFDKTGRLIKEENILKDTRDVIEYYK